MSFQVFNNEAKFHIILNSSSFGPNFNPPQYPVSFQPPEESIQEFFVKLLRNINYGANRCENSPSTTMSISVYLENLSNAITPRLSAEGLINFYVMGDEHLDTIPETYRTTIESLIRQPLLIVYLSLLPYFLSPLRIVTLSLRSLILLSLIRIILYPNSRLLGFIRREVVAASTTTHADNSLPEYDSFIFKTEPDQDELTSVVMEDILGDLVVDLCVSQPIYTLSRFGLRPSDVLRSPILISFPSGH
ncbi:hypothetical protein Tco_0024059 [Tanacetum coccineum]